MIVWISDWDYEGDCPGCGRELNICDAPHVDQGQYQCPYCAHQWPDDGKWERGSDDERHG